MHETFVSDFTSIPAEHSLDQQSLLPWIAETHAASEALARSLNSEQQEQFRLKLFQILHKLGLGPEKIQFRRMFFDDFFKKPDESKQIYDLAHGPQGAKMNRRSKLYLSKTLELFHQFYDSLSLTPPDHLIHTSCTGYNAPSAAQALVTLKNWGEQTTVTHAYHMGCYASIPSLRMAQGFSKPKSRIDIVHTEFCTLHMDPSNHSIGQLVIESLFADGAIKYCLTKEPPDHTSCFQLLKVKEQLLVDSLEDMRWDCSDFGFSMHLSKEVPSRIKRALKSFIHRLTEEMPLDLSEVLWAIHPGGPKIIEAVVELFNLKDFQTTHARAILKAYGNMSSATLPHVWELMLKDPEVSQGKKIISLAFGPGLTIAGALFEKRIP